LKLKQRRQAEREGRLHQEPGERGQGAGAESQLGTALFERPQELRSDIRLARRAVNQAWQTDKKLGELILEKVSKQALGVETAQPFTPAQLIATARLHLDVRRLNQADEHHKDRMEYYERALAQRVGTRADPAVELNVDDCGFSVQINLPDNGREPKPETFGGLQVDGKLVDGREGHMPRDLSGSCENHDGLKRE
jgi:hypothetical protein